MPDVSDWPLFTRVEKVRTQFAEGTKVVVAIGGWGDSEGFEEAAQSEEGCLRRMLKLWWSLRRRMVMLLVSSID